MQARRSPTRRPGEEAIGYSVPKNEVVHRRVLVSHKLVARSTPSLDSNKVGDVPRGAALLVVDEDLVDGVIRCKVAKDSTPRGICVAPIGWVTAVKDGELKLEPLEPADVAAASSTSDAPSVAVSDLPWSARLRSKLGASPRGADIVDTSPLFSVPMASPQSGQDSMASRIAKRRKQLAMDRHEKRSLRSEDPGTRLFDSSPSPAADETAPESTSKKGAKAEEKAIWFSSAELLALGESQLKFAATLDDGAQAKFDTVDAKLGRLLNAKKIKLNDLMEEWDRNHDGEPLPRCDSTRACTAATASR